jgi:hypothetical protein
MHEKGSYGILSYQSSSTRTTNQRNETKNTELFRQTHSPYKTLHCKKGLAVSRPQLGFHLPNSPWRGIIKLFPARKNLVSDIPAGDGKTSELF